MIDTLAEIESLLARHSEVFDAPGEIIFSSGRKDFEKEDWGLKALNCFFAVRDKSGKYLGTLEHFLNFAYINNIAEEKKDAHVSGS